VIDDSKFDEDDRRYLIEVITSQSADYQSTFTDANTSREELAEYFAFARALGLDKCGATAETVLPLMQGSGDDLGAVSGEYSVRFSEEGLKRLFSTATSDAQIRTLLRRIVVANCIGKGNIAAVAALYASDKVRALYDASGPNFIDTQSVLGEALQAGTIVTENVIPGVKFPPVSNDVSTRMLVAGLLDVERDLLRGFTALRELLTSGAPVHLDRFESRLQHFANALNRFDQADLGDNTVFAVIDGLIALSAPAPEPRSSVMSFECTGTDGKKKNLLFTNLAAVPSP
jgi:hypothetical protein